MKMPKETLSMTQPAFLMAWAIDYQTTILCLFPPMISEILWTMALWTLPLSNRTTIVSVIQSSVIRADPTNLLLRNSVTIYHHCIVVCRHPSLIWRILTSQASNLQICFKSLLTGSCRQILKFPFNSPMLLGKLDEPHPNQQHLFKPLPVQKLDFSGFCNPSRPKGNLHNDSHPKE